MELTYNLMLFFLLNHNDDQNIYSQFLARIKRVDGLDLVDGQV